MLARDVPERYRSRSFSGIIGDIKALSPRKARSLFARKKGLGKQYAWLYLMRGIDGGLGYQACAAEALSHILRTARIEPFGGALLDVGCAVGVTAGILELENVVGFDLFDDLLHAARLTDKLAAKNNLYVAADMTMTWPFRQAFDTVVCGLVCHHLKNQADILTFFSNAERVMKPGGVLIVTFPSGSVANSGQLKNIAGAIEDFGFETDDRVSGMVFSTDDPRSLFWMFLFVFYKTSGRAHGVFIHPAFGFPEYRTPITRVEKGARIKSSGSLTRAVRHKSFRLMRLSEMSTCHDRQPFTYPGVCQLISSSATTGL